MSNQHRDEVADEIVSGSRKTAVGMTFLAATTATLGLVASPAAAEDDTEYWPATTWNGEAVYLSTACHDRSDGIPGGPCNDNEWCGWSENKGSDGLAANMAVGQNYSNDNLLERGYKVRVGQGTLDQNKARSIAWGSTNWMDGFSPGTNDAIKFRTGLGELFMGSITSCYFESEFHSWNKGTTWLWDAPQWAWVPVAAIDDYLMP